MLRHDDMADAERVVNVRQSLLERPLAGDADDATRLVIGLGHVMVDDEDDLVFVPDPGAEFGEQRLEAPRPARVVEHRQVDPTGDDLAGHHEVACGGAGDELLGERGGQRVHVGCVLDLPDEFAPAPDVPLDDS